MRDFSPFSVKRARTRLALLTLPALAAGCEPQPLEITERPLFDDEEPLIVWILDANWVATERIDVQAGQAFTLFGYATGGLIPYTYRWRLGTEVISTTDVLDYSFSSPGDYTITLLVTDRLRQEVTHAVLVHVLPNTITVAIDIKPGSDPAILNLGANGTVPVAILGSATFDASTVDPLTVTLAGAGVKLRGQGTPMAALVSVNGDGYPDLVVHVTTDALELSETDSEAVLRGWTFDGKEIEGRDLIRVVP